MSYVVNKYSPVLRWMVVAVKVLVVMMMMVLCCVSGAGPERDDVPKISHVAPLADEMSWTKLPSDRRTGPEKSDYSKGSAGEITDTSAGGESVYSTGEKRHGADPKFPERSSTSNPSYSTIYSSEKSDPTMSSSSEMWPTSDISKYSDESSSKPTIPGDYSAITSTDTAFSSSESSGSSTAFSTEDRTESLRFITEDSRTKTTTSKPPISTLPSLSSTESCADVDPVVNLKLDPGPDLVNVSWDPPADKECVTSYRITTTSAEGFHQENETTAAAITIKHLDPCTNYTVVVATVHRKGEAATESTTTLELEPSEVQEINANATADGLDLSWTPPVTAPRCVKEYQVSYAKSKLHLHKETITTEETEVLLETVGVCINYTIQIIPITFENMKGKVVTLPNPTYPTDMVWISEFTVTKLTPRSIHVSWHPSTEHIECMLAYKLSWKSAEVTTDNTTVLAADIDSFTVPNLVPCTLYNISLMLRSIEKKPLAEVFLTNTTLPDDVEPVSNLRLAAGPDSVEVSWDPPTEVTCVTGYRVTCTNSDGFNHTTETTQTGLTIKELEPCTEYTVSVTTVGEGDKMRRRSGSATTSTSELMPSQVLGVTATATPVGLLVAWMVPKVAPKCVMSYKVSWDQAKTASVKRSNETTETELLLSDVNSCTKYDIQIIPITFEKKKGPVASIENPTYPTGTEWISKFTVTKIETRALHVSWTPTALFPECIEGYTLSWTSGDPATDNMTTLGKDAKSYAIPDLEPCTLYNITLIVYGADKLQLDNTSLKNTTASEAPGDVKVRTSVGEHLVTVGWDPPASAPACVTGYKVTLSPPDGDSDETTVEADQRMLRKDSLQPCTKFTLDVQALGIADQHGPVTTSNPSTLNADVDRVTHLKLEPGPDFLKVSWDPPAEATCVAMYRVITESSDGNFQQVNETTATRITVEHLEACTEYTVTVATVAKANKKGQNATATDTTLDKAPSEVTDIDAQATAAGLTVKWNPPVVASQCVKLYNVSYERTMHSEITNSTEVAATEVMLEDLGACIKYTIQIVAITFKDTKGKLATYDSTTDPAVTQPADLVDSTIGKSWVNFQFHIPAQEDNECELLRANMSCTVPDDEETFDWTVLRQEAAILLTDLPAGEDDFAINITKLSPFTSYDCSVTIVNQHGNSPNATFPIKTLPDVPSAPILHQIDEFGVTWLVVRWDKPTKIPGRLESYILQIKSEGAQYEIPEDCEQPDPDPIEKVIQDPNIFEYNFTMVTAFTQYAVQIKAQTEAGFGEYSEPQETITEPTVPGPPRTPKITGYSSTWIYFEWNRPRCIRGTVEAYHLEIHSDGPQYAIPDECDKSQPITEVIFLDNTTSLAYNFTNAIAYTLFTLQIKAQTQAGVGEFSDIIHLITKTSEPEPVRDVRNSVLASGTDTYNTTAMITWLYPCHTNGVLKLYTILMHGRRANYPDHDNEVSIAADQLQAMLLDLRPEYQYNIEVYTHVKNFVSAKALTEFMSPAGVPVKPQSGSEMTIAPDPFATENPTSMARIILNQSLFDEKMGEIMYYAVIIAQSGFDGPPKYGQLLTNESWPEDTLAWTDTKDNIYPYQTTPVRWMPFSGNNQRQKEFMHYMVGAEDCKQPQGLYCNGPLRPNTHYKVRIRAFTKNGFRDCVSVAFHTDKVIAVGTIIGIILGILVVGCFITFALYLKNEQPMTWSKKLCSCKEPTVDDSVTPRPIPVRAFPNYCHSLLNNANQLSSEYLLLATVSEDIVSPTSAAERPYNRVKNRYPNIKPYDDTRVKLRSIPDEFSDYINASYVKGYNGEIEYIATQGPKEETVDDFWQMVYENDVKQIIMVTQITEKGKNKCYKYYPDDSDPLICDNGIELTCYDQDLRKSFLIRHIKLKKQRIVKEVAHIQFHEWPDFGVPNSTDAMLQLCHEMRTLQSSNYGVIAVHCSAGVGRTGTVIVVDILVQAVHANRKLDVFGTVFNLRKQRAKMVQTEDQYKYIYNCIRDEILAPRVFQDKRGSSTYISNTDPEPLYENLQDLRKMSSESVM